MNACASWFGIQIEFINSRAKTQSHENAKFQIRQNQNPQECYIYTAPYWFLFLRILRAKRNVWKGLPRHRLETFRTPVY